VSGPVHLARRFFASLSTSPPAGTDTDWALAQLLPAEQELWEQLAPADQRHAVGVARDVATRLGSRATRPVLAAALLHDCGKLASGFGTFARVGATVWTAVRGRARVAAGHGRLSRYARHDELGAALLRRAGSDELTVTWAAEHHLPPDRWTLPRDLAEALKAADDD
jgi:hypothetical protein